MPAAASGVVSGRQGVPLGLTEVEQHRVPPQHGQPGTRGHVQGPVLVDGCSRAGWLQNKAAPALSPAEGPAFLGARVEECWSRGRAAGEREELAFIAVGSVLE